MTYHKIVQLFNLRIMSPTFPIHIQAQIRLQACTNIINIGLVFQNIGKYFIPYISKYAKAVLVLRYTFSNTANRAIADGQKAIGTCTFH